MKTAKLSSRIGISIGLAILFAAIGIIAAFLMVAWRHDNGLGLLFPIAMLIVITIAVLLLLMYLMARMHS